MVTHYAGALLPHRFSLACACKQAIGGLFSVALTVRSPPPDSRQHPALRSPDLPQRPQRGCCGYPRYSPAVSTIPRGGCQARSRSGSAAQSIQWIASPPQREQSDGSPDRNLDLAPRSTADSRNCPPTPNRARCLTQVLREPRRPRWWRLERERPQSDVRSSWRVLEQRRCFDSFHHRHGVVREQFRHRGLPPP